MARIDLTDLIQNEYASETRLETRFRPFREWSADRDIEGEIIDLITGLAPRRLLEVGCGSGIFGERLAQAAGDSTIIAIDQSQHMVDIARTKGIDARIGDVQQLDIADDAFDVVVANWMLYHLPDLDAGLAELARVLRPGGRLIAATMGSNMLDEVWSLVDVRDATPDLSFDASAGGQHLARHFAHVRCHDLAATAEFPDRDAVVEYVRSTLTRGHLADDIPQFFGALQARTTNVVFEAWS